MSNSLATIVGQDPSWVRCQLPEGVEANNITIPWDEKNGRLDSCNIYVDYTTSNSTVPCPDGYVYDDEYFSIVNQVSFEFGSLK